MSFEKTWIINVNLLLLVFWVIMILQAKGLFLGLQLSLLVLMGFLLYPILTKKVFK